MDFEVIKLNIVWVLTIAFASASILGYLSYKANLSPILGYLLAGYLIGPYSPGLVVDVKVAEQLAEIGVILMLFGVGLHFKWHDLISVKNIAVPGAIGQVIIASLTTVLLLWNVDWLMEGKILFGLAISVASTVVLLRVLTDQGLLHSPEGHLAVGWLIVEDIITVLFLLLVPVLAAGAQGNEISLFNLSSEILIALGKFLVLVVLMFTIGLKLIRYLLTRVVATHSHELFTLAILAMTFVVATGSAALFGTSMALGAFIAGMIMGQTHVKRKVAINAVPLRDAFAVIFFLSVGMLFNPMALLEKPWLFLGILGIILLIKPLTALLICLLLRCPFKRALIVSLALAQIGEFSFILAEQTTFFRLLPDISYDIIVGCALISIALNPLLFTLFTPKKRQVGF
jgi:CPA2 family monovalent cation:H+ antiporter-2